MTKGGTRGDAPPKKTFYFQEPVHQNPEYTIPTALMSGVFAQPKAAREGTGDLRNGKISGKVE